MAAETKEWTSQDNAQRDDLSKHNELATKTIQTDFAKLMECMDEEKSFWWKLPKFEKSFSSFQQLREWHERTYILKLDSYNAQFCARIPMLLNLKYGVQELYFDLMQEIMPDDIRRKHLAYITYRLKKFALSDDAFGALETNYYNYDLSGKMVPQLSQLVVYRKSKHIELTNILISRIHAKTNDFVENIVQFHQSTVNLIAETQN